MNLLDIMNGFGDVLLEETGTGGVITEKVPSVSPYDAEISNTVVKFESGGTGFLISTHQDIRIDGKIF